MTHETRAPNECEYACVEGDDCFDADNVRCWPLLTSLPIETTEDVQRVVRFYARR